MRLVIIGAGGHGKVVADCAERLARYQSIAFVDDSFPDRQHHEAWPVIANGDSWPGLIDDNTDFFVAIGHNAARVEWLNRISAKGGQLATLVHPRAEVSKYARIGAGTLVLAGAVVNAFADVGEGCIVNTCASIDHDCQISQGVHLAPGVRLAGTVSIGDQSFLGVGGAVIPNRTIGKHVIIGAGATVVSDLPDQVTAVGTPAKIIKTSPTNQ